VNVSKVPFYAPLSLFSRQSLWFDLGLLPAVILGAVIGRRIFAVPAQRVFAVIVLVFATLAALALIIRTGW